MKMKTIRDSVEQHVEVVFVKIKNKTKQKTGNNSRINRIQFFVISVNTYYTVLRNIHAQWVLR